MKQTYKLTPEQKVAICTAYVSGQNHKEIANTYGVESNTVYYTLRRHGIELRPKGFGRCTATYDVNPHFFEEVDRSEMVAYWAGFLAADGCVNDYKLVTLSLAAKDEAHIRAFLADAQSNHPIKHRMSTSSCGAKTPSVAAHIGCKQWVSDLALIGITPRKTFTLPFPSLNEEATRHYMRGYFDGDGCWFKGHGKPGFAVVGNEAFLSGFRGVLVAACGVNSNKLRRLSAPEKENAVFTLRYEGGENCAKIADFFYSGSARCLERKREKIRTLLAT